MSASRLNFTIGGSHRKFKIFFLKDKKQNLLIICRVKWQVQN